MASPMKGAILQKKKKRFIGSILKAVALELFTNAKNDILKLFRILKFFKCNQKFNEKHIHESICFRT